MARSVPSHLLVRSLGCATLVALVALSSPSDATAQSSRQEREAHALFERAEGLLRSGRFAEATGLLERSLAIYVHPSTAFNLAIARRGTGDALGAAELLAEIERGTYGELGAEHRDEATRMLAEVTAQIATLHLHLCGGNDVAARLDGEVWDRFDDCRDLTQRLNPGRHVLAVTGTGHRPLEETISVEAGQVLELERAIEPIPEGLLVVRVPDGVRVEIGGVGHAVGGLRRSVPAGEYLVRAFVDEQAPEERSVVVPGGGSGEIAIGVDNVDVALAVGLSIGIGVAVATAIGVIAFFLYDPVLPLDESRVFGVYMTLEERP
ncbi:MAG: hypothetical protein AB7S26_16660 [Sandaracinaceae bacterium]